MPHKFQSTPVISDGRIFIHRRRPAASGLFQSTPVISDGRIRRPPCCARSMACFNPRPSFLTGESRGIPLKSAPMLFQSTPVISDGRIVIMAFVKVPPSCFNPRPSFLTGESPMRLRPSLHVRRFQSTPVISDGRIIGYAAGVAENKIVSIHARHF